MDLLNRIKTKPLFTSDELPHYETVLLEIFGHLEEQPKTGKRGRPRKPKIAVDPEFKYVTVHKTRENGKVVKVERNIVFGDQNVIDQIIKKSEVSNTINTSFIERVNLTLRNHNKKLARKTLCFAKLKQALESQMNIIVAYYNFSKPHRSLTLRDEKDKPHKRTPAMVAGLMDRIWPMKEILTYPVL